jgi:hypothetical protein
LFLTLKEKIISKFKELKNQDYYFAAKDAGQLAQLILKLRFSLKSKNIEETDEQIISSLELILNNLPEWFKDNYSIAIFNSKYNELTTQIKNTYGKKQGSSNTAEKLMELINERYPEEL